MKNQSKLISKLLEEVEGEKISYSFKLEKDKIEILKEFFKQTKISPSKFFNELIDFEELEQLTKQIKKEKKENKKEEVKITESNHTFNPNRDNL